MCSRFFFVFIILVMAGSLCCRELQAEGLSVTIKDNEGEKIFHFNLLAAEDYRKAFQFLKSSPAISPDVSEEFFELLDTWQQACANIGNERLYADTLHGLAYVTEISHVAGKFRPELQQGVYARLGGYYRKQKAYVKAISFRETAYRYGGKATSGRNVRKLAELYKKVGMYEAALRLRRRQLEEGKSAPAELWRKIAELYFEMGKPAKGVEVAEPSVHPARRKWLVRQLWQYKYLATAEEIARKAIRKDQEGIQRFLAKILYEQKKFEASLYAAAKWYVDIPMQSERASNRVQEAAAFIARLHEKLGTLDKAIDTTKRYLDFVGVFSYLNIPEVRQMLCVSRYPAVVRSSEAENAKERLRVLRFHFYGRNREYQRALSVALKYSRDIHVHGKLRTKIRRYARKTFLQLLENGKTSAATILFKNAEQLPWDESHVKCAKYHFRMHKYGGYTAAGYFMWVAFSAATSDERLGKLATVFDRWKRYPLGWRLWRLIMRNPDSFFAYELQARYRLAGGLYRSGKYEQALDYVQYVHEKVHRGWGRVSPRENFLRFYTELTYLANEDADALIPLARNGELLQRRCAIEQLGKVGRMPHARILQRYKRKAPPVLHMYIESAITGIEGRHTKDAEEQPITSEQDLKKRLPENKTVRWIKQDPYEKSVRWAAVQDQFVVAASFGKAELRRYKDDIRWLRGAVPEARHVAFTEQRVWVGTDSGLFAYEREAGEWNLYAVGGELIECEIKSLEIRQGRIRVEVSAGQMESAVWCFSPESGRWRKIRGRKAN